MNCRNEYSEFLQAIYLYSRIGHSPQCVGYEVARPEGGAEDVSA